MAALRTLRRFPIPVAQEVGDHNLHTIETHTMKHLTTIALAALLLAACGGTPEETTSTPSSPSASYLPGINSGELTTALEKRGYTVEHNYTPGSGHTWTATGGDPGLTYTILYASDKVGTVQELSGTVMIADLDAKVIEAGHPFISSLVGYPAQPDSMRTASAAWVDAHYAAEGNSVDTIGHMEIRLSAPSRFLRLVSMRMVQ